MPEGYRADLSRASAAQRDGPCVPQGAQAARRALEALRDSDGAQVPRRCPQPGGALGGDCALLPVHRCRPERRFHHQCDRGLEQLPAVCCGNARAPSLRQGRHQADPTGRATRSGSGRRRRPSSTERGASSPSSSRLASGCCHDHPRDPAVGTRAPRPACPPPARAQSPSAHNAVAVVPARGSVTVRQQSSLSVR